MKIPPSALSSRLLWALLALLVVTAPAAAAVRVGIVYSATSASRFYDAFAYQQLFMAAQNQSRMAGIPYDLLDEEDLEDAAKLSSYQALVFPYMQFVPAAKYAAVSAALNEAVLQNGVGLVVAGDFLSNDENGAAYADPYGLMRSLLGLHYQRFDGPVAVDLALVPGVVHPMLRDYQDGEAITSYAQMWVNSFGPPAGLSSQVLAELDTGVSFLPAVQTTETGGRNVHFANDQLLGDTQLLWSAIQWVVYGDATPVALDMGRQKGLFVARNDMDQSMFAYDLQETEIPLYDLLAAWKASYDFVGSYFINIGDNPAAGEFTDWSVSGPLYQDYLALGNEIATHSWTHPHYTSELSAAELDYEFRQSALEIGAQLGITVDGAAIPGNPESEFVRQELEQWLSYVSGRSSVRGSGYPSAFGWLTPDAEMTYLSLNMSPDFTLVGFLGYTAEESRDIWQAEFLDLVEHAPQPVLHWLWHDYAATSEVDTGYSLAMFADTIALAAASDHEFITSGTLNERMRTHQAALLDVSGTNPLAVAVGSGATGSFSLRLDTDQVIESVTGWYAYDDRRVFLPEGGGNYTIQLGATPLPLTRITSLPMRAELLSVTGDGDELSFSFRGEGEVTVELSEDLAADFEVTGATSHALAGRELRLSFGSSAVHTVSLTGGVTEVLHVEGEDAELVGLFVTGGDPQASGELFIQVPPGSGNNYRDASLRTSRAVFRFQVLEPGSYYLEARMHSASGGDNSFWVDAEGTGGVAFRYDTPVGSSYISDLVRPRPRWSSPPIVLDLEAGEHVVEMRHREDGTRLDWLRLVPVPSP